MTRVYRLLNLTKFRLLYDEEGYAGLQIETLIFNEKQHKPLPETPMYYNLFVKQDELRDGVVKAVYYKSFSVCLSCHCQDDATVINEIMCKVCNGKGLIFDGKVLPRLWENLKIKRPIIHSCFTCKGMGKLVYESTNCLICHGRKVSYSNVYA